MYFGSDKTVTRDKVFVWNRNAEGNAVSPLAITTTIKRFKKIKLSRRHVIQNFGNINEFSRLIDLYRRPPQNQSIIIHSRPILIIYSFDIMATSLSSDTVAELYALMRLRGSRGILVSEINCR